MNILIFATSNFKPDTGGIAELGHQLARSLAVEGHRVSVLAAAAAAEMAEDDREPYRILRTAERQPREAAERLIQDEKPDLLFVLVIGSSWLTARRLGRKYDIPVALYVHGLEILKRNNPYPVYLAKQLVKGIMLRRSSMVMCNSFHTMQLAMRRGAHPEDIRVLHPGVEYAPGTDWDTPPTVDPAPGRFVFFTMGRVIRRKGIDQVIRALPLLLEEYPDLLYAVAGSMPEPYAAELKELVEKLSLSEHVRFLGKVSEEEKEQWYRRQDVFIMPSRHLENGDVEGFGIVFLEAGLYGKPVIGGDSGGVPDAVLHGRSGLLADPESPEAVAAAMKRLLEDSALRRRLGENGKQRAMEKFGWRGQARRFVSFCMPGDRRTLARIMGRGSSDYFNELAELPKVEPLDKVAALENLSILKEVLDNENLPFFLFFGTLLGALREKDFIDHDTDTDIVLFESYRQPFIDAIPALEGKGLRLVKTAKEDRVLSLYRNGAYIDIYFARLHRTGLRKRWYLDYSSVHKRDLLSFRRHSFKGLDLLIPERSEQIMRQLYGRNWRTPIRGYEANHDYGMKLRRFLTGKRKMTSIRRYFRWVRERKG
jgi:phosphatidylinositol alpha-1,6-mannosyltransferase